MATMNLSIAALKLLATPSLSDIYYITNEGQEGEWKCISLSGHSASEENTGTVLIGTNGAKYTRIYSGAINVSWFKNGTDWTQSIQSAIDAGPEIYFPAGEYLISGTIEITTSKRLYGPGTFTKVKNGLVFFDFLEITGSLSVVTIDGLTFNGSLDPAQSHWKKTDPFAGKEQIVVDKASVFIRTQSIKSIALYNIICSDLHGSAVYLNNTQYAKVDNCQFKNIAGTQAIVMWGEGELSVTNSLFDSIGLLPDTFFVNGVASNINDVYFHQFGDGVSAFNNKLIVTNNFFNNISRVSVTHDLNYSYENPQNAYEESSSIIKGNIIIHNHPNLKNSNPPATIWCELSKTAIISGNKIRYITRNQAEDNSGQVITFTATGYSETKAIISDNIIECDNFNNRIYGGITVASVRERSQVIISANILSGRISNAIMVGGSTQSQENTVVKICNNTIRIPDMAVEASCIRLEGEPSNMPGCIEILNNSFFSESDTFNNTAIETGKKVIVLGYAPAPFRLLIKGNNFNGGTAWLGNTNINLVFENNTDCAIYHLPDYGSTVQIAGNRFSKKNQLRGVKGVISGNFFADQLILMSCQDIIVSGNEFRMDVTDQLVLDVSYQIFARVVIKHNSFALYQPNQIAIHFLKTGAGIYDSISCIGNMFHGVFIQPTYGFEFNPGTIGAGTFLADNRSVGITALEKGSTPLNTNI